MQLLNVVSTITFAITTCVCEYLICELIWRVAGNFVVAKIPQPEDPTLWPL